MLFWVCCLRMFVVCSSMICDLMKTRDQSILSSTPIYHQIATTTTPPAIRFSFIFICPALLLSLVDFVIISVMGFLSLDHNLFDSRSKFGYDFLRQVQEFRRFIRRVHCFPVDRVSLQPASSCSL